MLSWAASPQVRVVVPSYLFSAEAGQFAGLEPHSVRLETHRQTVPHRRCAGWPQIHYQYGSGGLGGHQLRACLRSNQHFPHPPFLCLSLVPRHHLHHHRKSVLHYLPALQCRFRQPSPLPIHRGQPVPKRTRSASRLQLRRRFSGTEVLGSRVPCELRDWAGVRVSEGECVGE
jgi:hypothetical protein